MKGIHNPTVSVLAVDSPAGQVMETYKASLVPLRRMTIQIADVNAELVKPFSRWCVKSEAGINEGRAPDWDILIEILSGNKSATEEGFEPQSANVIQIIKNNPPALQLVRTACSELNTYATKLEQGLIGERAESSIQSPHSSRDSGQFSFKVEDLREGLADQIATVDPQYISRPGVRQSTPAATTTSSSPPPISKIRRSPLAAAVAAAGKMAKDGSK